MATSVESASTDPNPKFLPDQDGFEKDRQDGMRLFDTRVGYLWDGIGLTVPPWSNVSSFF